MLSLFIFAIFYNVQETNATGLAILVPRPIESLDAALSLTIEEGEFIPIDSTIQIRYDGQLATLPLGHILAQQEQPAQITTAENPKLNYAGRGIYGPYKLHFRLSDFIDDARATTNPIIVSLLYKTQVLAQSSSQLMPKG